MNQAKATGDVMAPSPMSGFVLFFTGLLIFSHFGRPFELILVGFKLPAIICGISIFAVFVSGAFREIRARVVQILCLMAVWMAIGVPFSTWRGGSVQYVLWYVSFWLILTLMVASAPRSVKHIAKLGYVTAAACVFHLISGGEYAYGRYSLTGTFGNSDDVALLAGYAIPFIVLASTQFRNPFIRSASLIGGTGYMLLLVGRTATRAAIPALLVMLAVYFIRAKGMQRTGVLVFSALASIVLVLALPEATLTRFGTIFDSFNSNAVREQTSSSEAMASVAERRELLRDALYMTGTHPLFGVGAGEFLDYRAKNMKNPDGSPKRYFPSHNTYLQIASETGIIGLILYIVFLGSIYTTIRKTRRMNAAGTHPHAQLISQIQLCLEVALAYFVVCAAFMTCDRHPHQFVLAGMAIALERVLQYWLNQQQSTAATIAGTAPAVPRRVLPSRADRFPAGRLR